MSFGKAFSEYDSLYDDDEYEEYLSCRKSSVAEERRKLYSRIKSRGKYDEATTLPCDDERFPAKKKTSSTPARPLLELSSAERSFYKYSSRLHGIRYSKLDYVPLDPNLDPPPYRCFSCWERGHMSRACTFPLIALFCRNCGRRDVDLENCPRCSRAYRRELDKRDTAAALREAATIDARKENSKKKADPLLDVSLLVNEGSVAGDDDTPPRHPLETIDEEFESKFDFTRDMVSDVKKLMEAVKHLSVKTQDRVLRQWLTERQKKL